MAPSRIKRNRYTLNDVCLSGIVYQKFVFRLFNYAAEFDILILSINGGWSKWKSILMALDWWCANTLDFFQILGPAHVQGFICRLCFIYSIKSFNDSIPHHYIFFEDIINSNDHKSFIQLRWAKVHNIRLHVTITNTYKHVTWLSYYHDLILIQNILPVVK